MSDQASPTVKQPVAPVDAQPMDASSPMATRPRVVPEKPVIQMDPAASGEAYNQMNTGVGVPMTDHMMASSPEAMQADGGSDADYSDPRQRVKAIEDKDYTIVKDADGNIIHRGKDRDKKWGLGEKIGSFFLGMFNGDGAIPAAMDRNYMEKLQDRRDLGEAYGSIQRQQAVEKQDVANRQAAAQADWMAARPQFEQQKVDISQQRVDVAAGKAAIDAEYKKEMVTLGKTKADNYKALRERELDLRSRGLDIEADKVAETIRNNKVNNDLRGRQVGVAEKRASLAVENARSKALGGGGARSRGQANAKPIDWLKAGEKATKLDNDFNSGKLTKEQYDALTEMFRKSLDQ